MFKRKIMGTLLEWKTKKQAKYLLVKGARQVGKTFIIREFGRQNYKNIVEIDPIFKVEHRKLLEDDFNAIAFYEMLSLLFPNVTFDSDTLLFFDNMQMWSSMIPNLRSLVDDGRCDIIVSTTTMPEYSDGKGNSLTDKYEHQIEMFAMDFEEFLWAKGLTDEIISIFREHFITQRQIDGYMNSKMLEYVHEYMLVGGIPRFVKLFLETQKNYGLIHLEQEKFITSYRDEIALYIHNTSKYSQQSYFDPILSQLGPILTYNQDPKFQKFSEVSTYDGLFNLLVDIGVVKRCKNSLLDKYQSTAYIQSDCCKYYVCDIGILVAMYGIQVKDIFFNQSLEENLKCRLYENFIADVLLKKGLELRFLNSCDSCGDVDFLYDYNGETIPIVVEIAETKSSALAQFINNHKAPFGYRFSTGNIKQAGKVISMPLYMAMFL
ncbi:MAG: AAA family ATPase [Christensenellaceae bacterium]|jgi:predicted AAA+ superfamily ATPase|nr:AAA family ATPase [Christensenellaceae bacterium]